MRSASATGVAVADSLDAAMMGWRVRGPTRCRPSMQPRGAGSTHTGSASAVHLHLHTGRSQESVWQRGPAARCARQNEGGGGKLWAQQTCREKRSPVTPCTPVPLLPLLPASRNAEIHHYPLIVLGQNEGRNSYHCTAFPEA